jgi:hypothetical protein
MTGVMGAAVMGVMGWFHAGLSRRHTKRKRGHAPPGASFIIAGSAIYLYILYGFNTKTVLYNALSAIINEFRRP